MRGRLSVSCGATACRSRACSCAYWHRAAGCRVSEQTCRRAGVCRRYAGSAPAASCVWTSFVDAYTRDAFELRSATPEQTLATEAYGSSDRPRTTHTYSLAVPGARKWKLGSAVHFSAPGPRAGECLHRTGSEPTC